MACGLAAGLASMGQAQTNGLGPAELPPAGFEGREYVDSRGCVFLRSTFGGEVTWIPRYGPDRQPVCNGAPSTEVQAEAAPEAEVADAETPPAEEQAAAETTPAPVAQPRPAAAPARATTQPRRPALPRADASGRHPSCPSSAPYGQLVDTTLGRPLVRCVISPALFLDPIHNGPSYDPNAPIALPDGGQNHGHKTPHRPVGAYGAVVQVGSFANPSNATRLRARLLNSSLPVRVHRSQGYDVVTLGPFSSTTDAQSALGTVRHMGFSDAFIRSRGG
ncbi:sporulation related protein [Roseinatronobacter bogoriensis subsp. barguzinensis]|uniref:SPOR domain-containing protein n=2 Tax=Roseinatronobacter bogoriensis TaxID=119542 RepID=A0A2K8K8R7_9RHOB|nr:hypothetical protein BG454_08350 [Rhodobaca barguzinensis]TDW38841.1 sporulation related protein [Rhodobaca barguzinensis]TDY68976.1 sporulation related protein [Rhodobaca bogoriensis DSM 18756]